jgi:UDP-2-acetamido-2,6-beta-L-arabino-hexul-4-ose reductase
MQILITGADGFIAKSLRTLLSENKVYTFTTFSKQSNLSELDQLVEAADVVIHLAGANRPITADGYQTDNVELTQALSSAVRKAKSPKKIIFSSSSQALLNNDYGKSKLAAENVLKNLADEASAQVLIYRLPNVFGKWCKPNYNSVVATFCHNIANGLPITINDPDRILDIVYVDDVISSFIDRIESELTIRKVDYIELSPVYSISLQALASTLHRFKASRSNLQSHEVGIGLERALYSTYMSYTPMVSVSYKVPKHSDNRGEFVELLKTPNAGQFSYFTAFPGITRGGHYHHTKTEKFLVIRGRALFKFRHILTSERYQLEVVGGDTTVVETIPGWAHDITNVGDSELIVMLWANEQFEKDRPDTYYASL